MTAAAARAPQPEAPRQPGLATAVALIQGARTAQTLVVLGLATALARSLPEKQYGTYQHVNFLAFFVPMLLTVPLSKAVVYFLPRTPDPTRFLRRAAVVLVCAGAALGAAAAFVPGLLRLADRDPDLVGNRLLVGAVLALAFPYSVLEPVMLSRRMRRGYTRTLLAVAAALLVGVGGGLLLAPPGRRLPYLLAGLLLPYAVQAGAALWCMLRPVADAPSPRPDPLRRPELLRFVLPVAATTLLTLLGSRLDMLLVPWVYPAEQFPAVKAIYFRGAMDVPILGSIAFTMVSLLAPELARHEAAGERGAALALFRRNTRLVALVSLPAVALLEATAGELLPLLFGPDYAASVPVFRLYVLFVVVRVFLPTALMEYTGGVRAALLCSAALLVLAATLSAVLVPLLGWVGAAAAMVGAAFVANWGLAGALARRHFRVPLRELVDLGQLGRIAAASAAALAVAHAVDRADLLRGLAPPLRLAGLGTVCAAVLLLGLRWFRAIPPEDLAALRQVVRRGR